MHKTYNGGINVYKTFRNKKMYVIKIIGDKCIIKICGE
jgi:hypothetical protein